MLLYYVILSPSPFEMEKGRLLHVAVVLLLLACRTLNYLYVSVLCVLYQEYM